MRKKKTLMLGLLASTTSIICQAQVEYQQAVPSANAAQYFNSSMSDNALCKGQISLNIPLYELPGKGYNLPISLSFYSGDVTHVTNESPIGLGWSLNAGGIISININSKPDTSIHTQDSIPWQYDPLYVENAIMGNLDMMYERLHVDMMPDSYSYSFPAHAGEIYVCHPSSYGSGAMSMTMMPDMSCKIATNNGAYQITDEYGNLFIFSSAESCQVDDYTSGETAWFLTQIRTREGGWFHFSYEDETYVDYDHRMYGNYVTNHTKRLTRIESDYGRVEFDTITYVGRKFINRIKCYDSGTMIKEYRLTPYYLSATGLDIHWDPIPDDCKEWYSIQKITEYNAHGEALPPYEFVYKHNFNFTKSSEGVPGSGSNNIMMCRMNDWAPIPTDMKYIGVDQWEYGGYYFTNGSNGTPILTGYYSLNTSQGWSENGDYFVLEKVKYPGGATEEFEYENHTYNSINAFPVDMQTIHSGLRLKAKQVNDGMGNIVNTTYSYQNGVLFNPSLYITTQYNFVFNDSNSRWEALPKLSSKPCNANMGQPVYYKIVEECIRDGSYELENAVQGSVIQRKKYYFSDCYTEPPVNYIKRAKLENLIAGTAYDIESTSLRNTFGTSPITMLNYPLGPLHKPDEPELIKVETLSSGGGSVFQTDKIDYMVVSSPVKYGYTQDGYAISRSTHSKNYRFQSRHTSQKNTFPVEEDTIRIYRNLNLNRIGSEIRTVLHDVNSTSCVFADEISPQSSIYNVAHAMASQNMLRVPILEYSSSNGTIVSGKLYMYGNHGGDFKIDSIMTFFPVTGSTSTIPIGLAQIPSQFKTTAKYSYPSGSYHPSLVKEVGQPQKKIIWGYNDRYPIAIIENYQTNMQNEAVLLNQIQRIESIREITPSNRDSVANVFRGIIALSQMSEFRLTLYTYCPGIGMTAMCNSDGELFFYLYDSFGRLKEIQDKDFQPIERYDYFIREGATILSHDRDFSDYQ